MPTKPLKCFGTASPGREDDGSPLYGLEEARKLARSGRFISAIKYLEAANLNVTREQAKVIVNSFGLDREFLWPENDRRPLRCL